MKKFKLVLCDIDGTLLNDDREMSERTWKDLHRLHEAGYMVGLASGRTVDNLKEFPTLWNMNYEFDMYIGVNGNELWDGLDGKFYKYNYLTPELSKRIVETVQARYDYTLQFMRDEKYYFSHMDDFIRASMSRNATHKTMQINDISDFWATDIPKILVRMPEEKMPEFEQYFKEHPIEGVVGYKTQAFVYEFMTAGTEKTVAMHHFCELHDIPLDEVISFGDTTNDNGIIRDSYGVCMINGSDDTKALAKEITELSNEEDGFADYVEKHLL